MLTFFSGTLPVSRLVKKRTKMRKAYKNTDTKMCYRLVEVGRNSAPLLRRVDCTYILTMEGSERVVDVEAAKLLTRRTVLQVNRGYAKCPKPGVTRPNQDIAHAYKHLATTILATTSARRVLILEDDFILESRDPARFRDVDEFVGAQDFDAYSLGSIGAHVPIGKHHRFVGGMVMCHACIWSRRAIVALSRMDISKIEHVDKDVLSKFPKNYGYRTLLATQTFPHTPNSATWPAAGRVAMDCLRSWFKIDERAQPGWDVVYFTTGPLLFSLLLVVTSLVLVLLARRLARRLASRAPP